MSAADERSTYCYAFLMLWIDFFMFQLQSSDDATWSKHKVKLINIPDLSTLSVHSIASPLLCANCRCSYELYMFDSTYVVMYYSVYYA
jgi:hypothetical protein